MEQAELTKGGPSVFEATFMKIMLSALLTLVCSGCAATVMATTASAINVATPADGAQVSSPFTLTASSSTCGSVKAVSMGYSIDNGTAIIEPVSFSARVSASPGAHVLRVKCWGNKTNAQTLLNITVVQPTPAADITVSSPASGAKVSSPFTVTARSTTCGSVPTATMGYSIDSGSAVIEPTSFSASVKASAGAHTLHVKCWGKGTAEQILIPITVSSPVLPSAATPQFSLASGQYTGKQVVSLFDSTPGVTIYYTTDGSGPSTSSPRYSGPISVASSMTIQALASGPSYTNSGFARASYTIVTPSGPQIPDNATSVTEIQLLPNWRTKRDPATNGTASGVMNLVSDPTLDGSQSASYDTSYSDYGGVLYSVTYGNDSSTTNFVYDAEVWIAAGSTIGNLEMDNNQVIANGDTIIYAFQCAGTTNTWDYSENAGTPANPVVKWVPSNQPCNPGQWTQNAWHHVQIQTSRDDAGNVTYHSVWLDGTEYPINQTVMSDFSLGWASGVLIANFQVDGTSGSGSSTLYLDNFTMYRW